MPSADIGAWLPDAAAAEASIEHGKWGHA